jgi:hypothetical protein
MAHTSNQPRRAIEVGAGSTGAIFKFFFRIMKIIIIFDRKKMV